MARVWSTAWRSSLSGRVLLAYLTLVVLVAMAGPGVAALAAGGPPDGGGGSGQAHIIVTKYDDANRNFVRDGGEAWLGGFAFELYSGPGSDGPWTLVGTGTTSLPNGQYQFGMYEFGWYKLTEVLSADQIAAGWVPTGGSASIIWEMTGEENSQLWFGNYIADPEPETGDLTIHKFNDLNEDGVWDAGEPALEGVEFAVAGVGTYSTDAAGKIELTDLEVGTYAVTETVPDGWDPTGPVSKDAVIVAGELTQLYFGNIEEPAEPETGDLIIYKFEDVNENGEYDDGEPMLEGWEFTVVRQTPPIGELSASAIMLIGTGTTDADGELGFSGLVPASDYNVTETLKDGWVNTTPLSQDAEVVAGEVTELWFGNVREPVEPETGDLTIDKFHDLSEDGVYDEGEDGIEGVEFTIVGPGGYSATATTDANGEISLTGLEPGEYTATETLPEGWKNTTPLVQSVVVVAGEEAQLFFGNIEESEPKPEPEPEPEPEPDPDDDDFLPYTPEDDEEDYLPFTGGEYALLIGAAMAAATLGGALRRRSDHTA